MKQSNPVGPCERTGLSLSVAFAAVLAIAVFIGYAYGGFRTGSPRQNTKA